MMLFLLAAAFSPDPSGTVGDATDRLKVCVYSKLDHFAHAAESADVTVRAAIAACLPERATLRSVTEKFVASRGGSKEAAARSYDMMVDAVRDEALVRIVTARAKNAKN